MIYTMLLEKYCFPKVVPIEVTILRGARRLRFSSALHHAYNDFAPKLWYLLSKVGYKKFLQRIYIQIEHEKTLKSPYYQFPILLAVVEALGLLKLGKDFVSFGKLDEHNNILLPEFLTTEIPTKSLIYIPKNGISFSQAVNQLLQNISMLPIGENVLTTNVAEFLFPQAIFTNGTIDLDKSPAAISKKIDSETLLLLKNNDIKKKLRQNSGAFLARTNKELTL